LCNYCSRTPYPRRYPNTSPCPRHRPVPCCRSLSAAARRDPIRNCGYPDVSLKDARDRRDASRKLLAERIDPSENRKAMKSARTDRAANSFELVAREWFAKYSTTWAANHGNRIIRRFERDIFPWIGGCQRRSKSRPLGRSKNRPVCGVGIEHDAATAAPAEMAGVS